MAGQSRMRRRIIRAVSRRFPGGAPFALPLLLRWGSARGDALLRRRGLVRGTVIAWPYAGRAWTVSQDVVWPGRGEVLVQILASVVSPGTERAFFTKMPNAATKFPFFPGYSAAGEVVAVGKKVSRFRPGDRVALAAEHGSLALAREEQIVAVPAEVSLEEAAFVQLGVIALQAVQKAPLRPGEPVVVLGLGLIGQILAQIASAAAADPVICVARSSRRVSVPLLGAAQRVIVTERDGIGALDGLEAAVTFEVTGSPEAIPLAMRCTRPGGRIVLAGSTRGATRNADFGLLADKRITITGAHITSLPASAWPVQAEVFMHLVAQRRIALAPLITERVHPMEAEWFYRRLSRQDDPTIGAIFCWDRLLLADRMQRVSFVTFPDFTPLRRGRMTVLPVSKRLQPDQKGAA